MAKRKEEYLNEPTPTHLLPLIADWVHSAHCSMLDPFAGEGEALDYLSSKWHCSRYGVEPDPKRFEKLQARAKAHNECFEDLTVKNFPLIYAFPPSNNQMDWTTHVFEACFEGTIVIWRLPVKLVSQSRWIDRFSTLFDEWEFYRDPGGNSEHYTIRCKARAAKDTIPSIARAQELARAIEHAQVLGAQVPKAWSVPYYHSRGVTFRLKQLEWVDVYPELQEFSWPRFQELFSPGGGVITKGQTAYQEQIDAGTINPAMTDPFQVHWGIANTWSDAYAIEDNRIYMLSMVGRRSHIEMCETGLKRGEILKLGHERGKLLGGGLKWKENYQRIMIKLPNTGAFHCLWVHRNSTPKASSDWTTVCVPTENNTLAAKIIANHSGLPIAPEWVEYVVSELRGGYGYSVKNLNWRFLRTTRETAMKALSDGARRNDLPTPTRTVTERLRPVMPPSAGIWAQLALQGFVNDIPLPSGIILHAEPLELIDTEVGEALDKRIEKTRILRKDAVRFSVFHYEDWEEHKRGDWEIFESETVNDDDDESPTTN